MENLDHNDFIKICKNLNSPIENLENNYYLLKNYFEKKTNDYSKYDYINGYEYIYLNFKNCDNNNEIIYYIYIIRFFIKYLEKNNIIKLIDEINKKANVYNNNKYIVSSLKSLIIYCNKYINTNNINKKIEYFLDVLNKTDKIKRIYYYLNKINYLLDKKGINKNNYNNILKSLNDILKKEYNKNLIEYILNFINKCKKYGNISNSELEDILLLINKNIYLYIYFLKNNDNLYDNKESILDFISNIGYNGIKLKDIDLLNLKRGFITGIEKDNKSYLLKYQPNKSVMELLINSYLYTYNYNNFLLPNYFYINEDNSYFYIIEKYNSDLYKYFNVLEKNNKILSFKTILYITKFIIDSISILHKNNIIHSDLKLENIVLNIDEYYDISEIKIIDFDVALFNVIPEYLNNISEKYEKILKNKKPRGTRIYMIKEKEMSFNNDIYSLGVISLVLMYKNIKLFLTYDKNIDNNKIIQKLMNFRRKIENNNVKLKMLNYIKNLVNKNKNILFLDEKNNIKKYFLYNNFIIDCINNNYNIEDLKEKYISLFS